MESIRLPTFCGAGEKTRGCAAFGTLLVAAMPSGPLGELSEPFQTSPVRLLKDTVLSGCCSPESSSTSAQPRALFVIRHGDLDALGQDLLGLLDRSGLLRGLLLTGRPLRRLNIDRFLSAVGKESVLFWRLIAERRMFTTTQRISVD